MKKEYIIFGAALLLIVGIFGVVKSLPQGSMSVMASYGLEDFGNFLGSQSFEFKTFMLSFIVVLAGLVLFVNQIFKVEKK